MRHRKENEGAYTLSHLCVMWENELLLRRITKDMEGPFGAFLKEPWPWLLFGIWG